MELRPALDRRTGESGGADGAQLEQRGAEGLAMRARSQAEHRVSVLDMTEDGTILKLDGDGITVR